MNRQHIRIALFLAAVILLCFVGGCGKDDDNSSSGIAMDESITADIDCDGDEEEISIAPFDEREEDDGGIGWRLCVKDGEHALSDGIEYAAFIKADVVDINDRDEYLDILVAMDYSFQDYATCLYRFIDGELMLMDELNGVFVAAEDGVLSVESKIDILGTWDAQCDFVLSEGGGFEPASLWEIILPDEPDGDPYLTTVREVDYRTEEGVCSLPIGTRLLPTETDGASVVYFCTEDGVDGWFEFSVGEDNWPPVIIGGVDASEIFDGIRYE